MDRLAELAALQGTQGVEGEADPTALLGGQLGGALARLGGAPGAPATSSALGPDGIAFSGDEGLAGNEGAAALTPGLAQGLASWLWDGRIQKESQEVLQLKEAAPAEGPSSQQDQGQKLQRAVETLKKDYDQA
ncbi:MAG: hypothetical protein AB1758_38065, partial [Candidatus Eremiobacterota bacterium]